MLSLIAAYANNRVIGAGGRIPWHIPGEQRRFRDLTMGHSVIMGRRTFSEIGKALPGRDTIVLSRDSHFQPTECRVAPSLEKAIAMAEDTEIFIAGGAGVYAEALPLCRRLYITEIDADINGDTFFPAFDESAFEKTVKTEIPGPLPYRYVTYVRKFPFNESF